MKFLLAAFPQAGTSRLVPEHFGITRAWMDALKESVPFTVPMPWCSPIP